MNPPTQSKLAGVLPVFQTPFHEHDESIDVDTLAREIDWLYACGADGIVMAMVSEILRLSTEERRTLAELAARLGRERGAVVISVGAESAVLAEAFARHAQDCGADAIMAIPPVSVALPEDQLRLYYRRIARSVSIPLIVQDASGYVGRPMSIALQAQLLDEFGPDRILFKPEATPIAPRLKELRDATAGHAKIFEGTGGLALLDTFPLGIVGTMPGADLIRPIVALWRALIAGDQNRADRLASSLCAVLTNVTSLDAFLAVEKHLLLSQGIFRNTLVRGPIGYVLDEDTRREVDRHFDQLMQETERAASRAN